MCPVIRKSLTKLKFVYETALKDRRYCLLKSFNNGNIQTPWRNRNRKVIRFNPLVWKHFSKNNKYHKILNWNTLKLSYYCTTNIRNIIKQCNSKVLDKTNDNNNRKCNYKSKPNCYNELHLQHKPPKHKIKYKSTALIQYKTRSKDTLPSARRLQGHKQ